MAKSSNRDANVRFNIEGGDRSKQEIAKIRQATEDFGDEGKKSAQKLVDAFSNIEKAEDKLTKKISQGRAVTVGDANVMIQQFAALESQILETFGSLENAPAEVQEAFGKAQQTLDRTKDKVRELTDAVDDQKGELKEGGEQWTGLGDAMNKALGPMGKVQAQMLLVGAAFKEGWSIGMQLNKFFGTDMQVWDDVVSRFGAKAHAVLKALSDNAASLIQLVISLFSGSMEEVKRSFAEVKDNFSKSWTVMTEVVTKYGAEWDALHPKIETVLEAQRKAQEEAAKLAEAKRKLGEQIRDVTLSLQEETAELEKQRIAAQDAEHGAINTGGQVEYLKRTLDGATASLTAQKQELVALTARYGEHDPVVNQARERLQQLESSVRIAKESYANATAELKRYEDQQRAAEAAIRSGEESTGKLTKRYGELALQIEKLVPGYVHLSGATTAVAVETEKADAAVAKLAESVKKVDFGTLTLAVPQVDAITAAVNRLSAALDEAAEKAAAMGSAIGGAAEAGLGGGEEPESRIPPRSTESESGGGSGGGF